MSSAPTRSGKTYDTQPRWGWSGVSRLKQHSQTSDLQQLIATLPARQSSDAEILARFAELRARFHGWLHQDEFGPTRSSQTAALRALTKLVERICQLLKNGAHRSRERLDAALRNGTDALSPPLVSLAETAAEIEAALKLAGASEREVGWFSRLKSLAGELSTGLHELDDATDAQIFETGWRRNLELSQNMAATEFGLTEAERLLHAYQATLGETLQRLKAIRGAQERSSLKLLVEELCHLWGHETGLPVAAHGIVKDRYTSRTQTDAGRFVTAVVEAMLPDKSWFDEHAKFAHSVRAQTFLPDEHGIGRQACRAAQALVIMRDFVARRSRPAKIRLRTR
jgi:hypothetical protein